jgi:hypothetical protein
MEAIPADVDSDRADGWWWICVTWMGSSCFSIPPQIYVLEEGARPGHPITGTINFGPAALSDKEFVRSRAIGPGNRSRELRKGN